MQLTQQISKYIINNNTIQRFTNKPPSKVTFSTSKYLGKWAEQLATPLQNHPQHIQLVPILVWYLCTSDEKRAPPYMEQLQEEHCSAVHCTQCFLFFLSTWEVINWGGRMVEIMILCFICSICFIALPCGAFRALPAWWSWIRITALTWFSG